MILHQKPISTSLSLSDGALHLQVNQDSTLVSDTRVDDNQWHNMIISFNDGPVKFIIIKIFDWTTTILTDGTILWHPQKPHQDTSHTELFSVICELKWKGRGGFLFLVLESWNFEWNTLYIYGQR